MRILGLDFGDKTIGVAVSDPLGWTAQGVEIIKRDNPQEFKKCMRRLAEIIEQYQVDTIVLGYPKNLDNSEGERCEKTKADTPKSLWCSGTSVSAPLRRSVPCAWQT